MDTKNEMKQGFLPIPSEDGSETDYNDWRYEKTSLRRKYIRRFAIVQIVLLLLYTAVTGVLLRTAPVTARDSQHVVDVVHVEPAKHEDDGRGDEFVYSKYYRLKVFLGYDADRDSIFSSGSTCG